MSDAATRLTGAPEKIFVSVDESTGRSTLSFAPADVAAPIQFENDPRGELALTQAREIAAAYPGSAVVGPHYHAARGKQRVKRGRR